MQTRLALLSLVTGGIAVGALASQVVPVSPRAAEEPAWRALVQPQYRQAYTPASYGGGPEDSSGAALVLTTYQPDAVPPAYTLPPEYAAAERFAQEEARAAAAAERQFRQAYAQAAKPDHGVTVTRGNEAFAEAAPLDRDENADDAAENPAPEAKVITVAAADDSEA